MKDSSFLIKLQVSYLRMKPILSLSLNPKFMKEQIWWGFFKSLKFTIGQLNFGYFLHFSWWVFQIKDGFFFVNAMKRQKKGGDFANQEKENHEEFGDGSLQKGNEA